MGRQIKTIYKKAESSFNNPENKKKWQGGIGILVMVVFVLSSVLFNNTVQALNQAAGNYGYSSGSYGYSASTTSDAVPAAPTNLTRSAVSTTSMTLTWTTPILTTSSTALNNLQDFLTHYSSSSLSACSGGSQFGSSSVASGGSVAVGSSSTGVVVTAADTTPESGDTDSVSITGLTANTTYYFAICARDANSNSSSALTGSFATSTESAATGGGGTVTTISSSPTTAPTVATAPVAPTITPPAGVVADAAQLAAQLGVKRDVSLETVSNAKVTASAKELKVTLSSGVQTVATNFIAYGVSTATKALGSGERGAVVRDALDTLGSVANNENKLLTFLGEIANGQKPTVRNIQKERQNVAVALKAFAQLTKKSKPDFKNAKDDLAWNTIMYRIRFPRDLVKEKTGIAQFKKLFKRNPKTPLDWSVVRAYGYVLSDAANGRTRCWQDAECTELITAQLVTKDDCKAVGGKGWGASDKNCTPI